VDLWEFRGLEELLDRWETADEPDDGLKAAVYTWLLGLYENPTPPEAAPVPNTPYNLWIAVVLLTTVHVLYEIIESEHALAFFAIDTC
jgi:hypothetical protein